MASHISEQEQFKKMITLNDLSNRFYIEEKSELSEVSSVRYPAMNYGWPRMFAVAL